MAGRAGCHGDGPDDRRGESGHVLAGGFVNAVVRVGDTVRRPPAAPYVRDLLHHLERCGWPGAPRWYGIDEQGREVLSFLDGHVAWEPQQPPEVRSEESLIAVARLVRQFHDLTAGTELARDQEVACHNDLSPKNTVYRDLDAGLRPTAFIDWDIAAPGARIHDVAHVCWQYIGLGPSADIAHAARLVAVVADAYGTVAARPALVETILWWQDRCWRGIDAAADAGEPAMVRLREQGAMDDVRAAYEWTSQHRSTLERELN
jgi:Ser/Thr protein kinase RdoA (MazF antagonist)